MHDTVCLHWKYC